MEKVLQENLKFIKHELLPEMVFNRCFCEPGSREFVEFESADLEALEPPTGDAETVSPVIYKGTAKVQFSGETTSFPILVKLGSNQFQDKAFQNEQLFYSKIAPVYKEKCDFIPECYVSDLETYGRPVLVLKDLNFDGFGASRELDGQVLAENHLKLISKALANFHGRGLKFRNENYENFQEICRKFRGTEIPVDFEKFSRFIQKLIKLSTENKLNKIKNKLIENQNPAKLLSNIMETNEFSTICHGNICKENLLFKYETDKERGNGEIPLAIKIIDFRFFKFSSMSLDLAPLLLLTNSPLVVNKDQFEDFLQSYVQQLITVCPETSEKSLRKEIVSKLYDTFVILSVDKKLTDDYLLKVLQFFEKIENANY